MIRRAGPYLALSVGVILLAAGVLAAVIGLRPGVSAQRTASVSATGTPEPTADPRPTEGLDAALATLATGRVSFAVAVVDRRTGQTYAWNEDLTFITASIVKVEILAELVALHREAGEGLSASQLELAAAMIQYSDNAAADTLWRVVGGAAGMAAADDRFGLTATTPNSQSWGLTTTTVTDQVALLDALAEPDGPLGDDNRVVLDLMGSITDDQAWGVSAAARDGESIELKNGWLARSSGDGTWNVNSIGMIHGASSELAISVLSQGHASLADGIAFVESVATLTRGAFDPAA